MKKRNLIITALLTMAVMAGCGDTKAPEAAPETEEAAVTEETAEVGMANPWRDSTEEEARAAIPRMFKAPEGAKDLRWTMMDDASEYSPMVDLQFVLDGMTFDARAMVTGDDYEDISGLNYEWAAESDVTLANWAGGEMQGKTFRNINESGMIDLITWYDVEIGISYCLSVADTDLEGFDIQAVAEQMYTRETEVGLGLLRDNEDMAKEEIENALRPYLAEAYGENAADFNIEVTKVYDDAETNTEEFLTSLGLADEDVAFEVSYEIKPKEGIDEDGLMLLTVPDGVYDEASGLVKEIHRVGVLTLKDGSYAIKSENFGTGW